jgi:ubiquinone/menaquinone biosynthesis C-methylase UbiE
MQAALGEIEPGQSVLQAACVYGDFSVRLAERVTATGRLEVIDVSALQVARCRRKLAHHRHARVRQADIARLTPVGAFDVVCCFFLLHEVPEDYKRRIVDNVLANLAPRGRAVFMDYHRPVAPHALERLIRWMLKRVEPFAGALWENDIRSYATHPERYRWKKATYFGGLYQRIVVELVEENLT